MRKAKLYSFFTKQCIEYPEPLKVKSIHNTRTGKTYHVGDILMIDGCGYVDKRYKIKEFFQLSITKGWMMRGYHLGASKRRLVDRGIIGYPEDVEVVVCQNMERVSKQLGSL